MVSPWKQKRRHRRRRIVTPRHEKPLPMTTAKSLVVIDLTSGRVLAERKAREPRSVASLTKVVTALVTLRLCQQNGLDLSTTYLPVSKRASSIRGTSACLQEGDVLTVRDLLHALLLPSGNDAATTLAEGCGRLMLEAKVGKEVAADVGNIECEKCFVEEMQRESDRVGNVSGSTNFLNPHGMDQRKEEEEVEQKQAKKQCHLAYHHSTAKSMANFAVAALDFPMIESIVTTKKYSCQVKSGGGDGGGGGGGGAAAACDDAGTELRKFEWLNTNKMLWKSKHAIGMKTGWTKDAGPCLCSVMRVPVVMHCGSAESSRKSSPRTPRSPIKGRPTSSTIRKFRKVLVLTLGSESKSERWVEHTRIHRWARKHRNSAQSRAFDMI